MDASWRETRRRLVALLALVSLTAGCGTMGNIIGGTIGATVVGAYAPAHEIEQIYYLGVFDPQAQIPEAIYRVSVKGQASFISGVKFASGWVPAAVIDSLGGRVSIDPLAKTNDLTITAAAAEQVSRLQTGRRLVLFGPEGFREAPRDHRLVIVMGASPHEFFQAIDSSLAQFSSVRLEQDNSALQRQLFEALLQLRTDQQAIKNLELDVARSYR